MKSLSLEQMEKIEGGVAEDVGCWGYFGYAAVSQCAMELQSLGGGNGNYANCYHICYLAMCVYPITPS